LIFPLSRHCSAASKTNKEGFAFTRVVIERLEGVTLSANHSQPGASSPPGHLSCPSHLKSTFTSSRMTVNGLAEPGYQIHYFTVIAQSNIYPLSMTHHIFIMHTYFYLDPDRLLYPFAAINRTTSDAQHEPLGSPLRLERLNLMGRRKEKRLGRRSHSMGL